MKVDITFVDGTETTFENVSAFYPTLNVTVNSFMLVTEGGVSKVDNVKDFFVQDPSLKEEEEDPFESHM